MTKEQKNELIRKLAKGRFQYHVLYDLLNGYEVTFCDYVSSTRWYASYVKSFENIISRLKEEGYQVKIKKGKLGGYWTATAKIA
jgi:hypothetical protein